MGTLKMDRLENGILKIGQLKSIIWNWKEHADKLAAKHWWF